MTYNPFNKPINQPLNEADLMELVNKQVAEGYYIEYKGAIFPTNPKIGHSIASLANSYGGWYFVGIETDAANVANNVVGFDLATYSDPIAKIREIVKSNIDPVPVFYVQQVNITQPNRAVIVVYVPPEQDTPFITRDGRIYRRNHDSSDPIPEANRYTIDRLVEEGQKTKEAFVKFCRDERTFSQFESDNKKIGWLNIFIKPYSYETITRTEWTKEHLRALLQQSNEKFEIPTVYQGLHLNGCLPFNSIYPTSKSIVLKQNQPYYSAFQGLTVEFYFDGRAKFHIPISFFNLEVPDFSLEYQLENMGITSGETKELFRAIGEENNFNAGFNHLRFFNAGQLSLLIITLSTFYLNWLRFDDGLIINLKIALKVDGAWRAVPYFDDDEWARFVREFGFPIGISDTIFFPENIGDGRKLAIEEKNELGNSLCGIMGLMFGFPDEVLDTAIIHYLTKAQQAEQNQPDD